MNLAPARLALLAIGAILIGVGLGVDLGAPGLGTGQLMLAALGAGYGASALLSTEWQRRVLLASAAGIFSLLLAEAALRLLVGDRLASPYRLNSESLHEYVPNSQRQFHHLPINGGQQIDVAINSMGLRGDKLSTAGESRILVYGDSFVAAEFSALKDTYVERLEQHLIQATGQPIEAVNAGVIAAGPDQMALWLERDLPRLSPDLVVVALYAGNDYGDLLRNKLFRLGDAGQLEHHSAQISDQLEAKFSRARKGPLVLKLLLKAWRRIKYGGASDASDASSATMQHQRIDDWYRQCLQEYDEFVERRDPVVRNLLADAYDADLSLTPNSNSARYKVQLMERVLERMQQTAAAFDVPLAFVIIPSAMDVVDNYDFATVDPAAHPPYRAEALTDTAVDILERLDAPYLNLWSSFSENQPQELYFRGGEIHWTAKGQDLAAARTAAFLAAEELVPPARP